MNAHNTIEFRTAFLEKLDLQRKQNGEKFSFLGKENCYEFVVAKYTIPSDFELEFLENRKMIRFGILSSQTNMLQIENQEMSAPSPSSFLVIEECLSGKQTWKKGQHFHGVEVTIYWDYFCELLKRFTGKKFDVREILLNHIYHYLPTEVLQCINKMCTLAEENRLNSIYFEGLILECIAIFYHEFYQKKGEFFLRQEPGKEITIGGRKITLSYSDIESIRKAHFILSENPGNPPTIEALSKEVFLNTQKLKAGFSHQYHMTIGEYILTNRMALAANLLSTTSFHIQDIAGKVGYAHTESFIKAFKQYYHKTPLQFKKTTDESVSNQIYSCR